MNWIVENKLKAAGIVVLVLILATVAYNYSWGVA